MFILYLIMSGRSDKPVSGKGSHGNEFSSFASALYARFTSRLHGARVGKQTGSQVDKQAGRKGVRMVTSRAQTGGLNDR